MGFINEMTAVLTGTYTKKSYKAKAYTLTTEGAAIVDSHHHPIGKIEIV